MTQAPHRRRLVPRAAVIATIVILLVVASSVAAAYFVARSRLVAVPDVSGLSPDAAEQSLFAEGLQYEVAGTRVSASVPSGLVITQDPASGTLVDPGVTVGVVLSVGPQTFPVPDLVGTALPAARDMLVSLGLKVVTVPASADSTEAVVLEMFPAPGASVSPGDEIRLSVPGGSGATDVLLPYDLTGVTVLIDPLPAPASVTADAPMEIARRLQALLEAAGAKVTSTRTGSTEGASPDSRAAIASASRANLFIGIDVGATGAAGITVAHVASPAPGDREVTALAYARAITRAATLPDLVVNEPTSSFDPVLAAFPGPGVRVIVGDSTVEQDRARFGDPAWADQVARAIYRGVGTSLEGK